MFSQHSRVDRRLQLYWRIAHTIRHQRMKVGELAYALDDLQLVQREAAPLLRSRIFELQALALTER